MDMLTDAMRMFEQGRTNDAIKLLQKCQNNANDEEMYTIATLYRDYGFFEEAIKLLELLLKKYPTEGQIIVTLAALYIELEQDDLAVHLLDQIVDTDDFYGQSLLLLADIYQSQGLFEVSEHKLLEAKEKMPNEVIVDFALGELLFSIGQYQRAIPFYEKAVKEEKEINGVLIHERLAESYASLGHYEQSYALYEELKSEQPDILFKHGIVARQIKRNDIAIRVWEKLKEIDPHYYTVYEELSQTMLDEGMIKEAYDVVQEGLSYDEFNKAIFLLGGKLAIQLDKVDEAITLLTEAIALDNDYKEAIIMLLTLFKAENHHDKIIQLLTDLKQSGSEDPQYDWELAKAYEEEEQYGAALKAYEEAHMFLAHDSEFLRSYGYFLLEDGQIEKASAIFKKYQNIEPYDEEINDLIERINLSNES